MKLKREARTLKSKAMASLRRGMEVFNSHDDLGRHESVLLHLQHSAEMLIKALLFQKGKEVFDKERGTSIGIKGAVSIAQSSGWIDESQAGAVRTIDTMRDQAQHWMIVVAEDALYINARALVTAIDRILAEHFEDSLADNLPLRVLPLSTHPIPDFQLLVNREYEQIRELLAPGKRARDEARGRVRALLSMEAHVSDTVSVSERDVNRIEKAVRDGASIEQVFPRLMTLASNVAGEGPTIRVHFSKREGPAVRYVSGDDPGAAAAIREVDLQKKYHWSPQQVAERLGISTNRAKALRDYLGIDAEPSNMHVFEFGSQRLARFSDNAMKLLEANNNPKTIDAAWAARSHRGRRKPAVAPVRVVLPQKGLA